jgi:hypothetical protein
MDKLIEVARRAVADYGFRQVVLYDAGNIGRRAGLSQQEQAVLTGTVLELLTALPVPVEPEDIPGEQARLAGAIRAAAGP